MDNQSTHSDGARPENDSSMKRIVLAIFLFVGVLAVVGAVCGMTYRSVEEVATFKQAMGIISSLLGLTITVGAAVAILLSLFEPPCRESLLHKGFVLLVGLSVYTQQWTATLAVGAVLVAWIVAGACCKKRES